MATRVISPAGGNWNVAATWVGGIIPTAADDIQFAATSGPLVVNVNASILSINLTSGYNRTFTINASITLSLTGVAISNTFSGVGSGLFAYNFLGTGATQGRIAKATGAGSFTISFSLSTVPIPCFQNNSTGQINASTLYFINLISIATLRIDNSGGNVFIQGNWDAGLNAVGGDTRYNMVGTGTLNVLSFGIGGTDTKCIINTSGTITINPNGFGFGTGINTVATIIEFRHTLGTIVNPTIRANINQLMAAQTLSFIAGTTWDFYALNTGTAELLFAGTPQFDKFIVNGTPGQFPTATQVLTLRDAPGPTVPAIVVNELNVFTSLGNVGGTYYRAAMDLVFDTTFAMVVNSIIDLNGGSAEPNATQTPVLEIRCQGGGSAVLTVNSYSQYISRVRFTDITCAGGLTVYGQALTLSNTVNIQQYTLPPGGPSSHVFFS